MKIVELQRMPKNKIGRIDKKAAKPEPHEESTAVHLTQFGLDIDFVKPVKTYKTSSADVFMLGSIWEMKSPITYNKSTIKEDFRKAKSQSDKIIFDLRRVKKYADEVEKQVIGIFKGKGRVRRLIIIKKDGRVFDFYK